MTKQGRIVVNGHVVTEPLDFELTLDLDHWIGRFDAPAGFNFSDYSGAIEIHFEDGKTMKVMLLDQRPVVRFHVTGIPVDPSA